MAKTTFGKIQMHTQFTIEGSSTIYTKINGGKTGALGSGDGRCHDFDKDMPVEPVHETNTARCHYCGMPAKSTNFFDVPVCDDCQ
jgi:hypothetical protein